MNPATHSSAPAENAAQTAPDPAQDRPTPVSLIDMHPSVGDILQIDCGSPIKPQKAYVKLVGYLKDRAIVITAPTVSGHRLTLIENDSVLVRGFSGLNAYAFQALVIHTGRLPFDHVHLSFPDKVFGKPIRRSQRVRTELEARVVSSAPGAVEPIRAQVQDISAIGALIAVDRELDAEHPLQLNITLTLHGNPVNIDAACAIVSHPARTADKASTQAHHYGVKFSNLTPHDVMLLTAYVYQQIVDYPGSAR